MKKYLFVLVGVLFAWPVSAAPSAVDKAVAEKMVLNQFNQVMDQTVSCREALESGEYGAAVKACEKALQLHQEALAYAKQNKIRVEAAISSQPTLFLTDPFTVYPDVREDLLFARVMNGEQTLQQALEGKASWSSQDGLVGYFYGAQKVYNPAYSSVVEAFRAWPGCKQALQEANTAVDAAAFCK